MPKRRQKNGNDIQPSLFAEAPAVPGSDHLGPVVRGVITRVIHNCRLSREQIADRMSEALGTRVTARMLNDWTADSKELHRFPLEFVLAFCRAVDDWSLLSSVVERCGVRVISNQEARMLEFAQASLSKELADREHEYRIAVLAKGQGE
jgi:hypothetical protein